MFENVLSHDHKISMIWEESGNLKIEVENNVKLGIMYDL